MVLSHQAHLQQDWPRRLLYFGRIVWTILRVQRWTLAMAIRASTAYKRQCSNRPLPSPPSQHLLPAPLPRMFLIVRLLLLVLLLLLLLAAAAAGSPAHPPLPAHRLITGSPPQPTLPDNWLTNAGRLAGSPAHWLTGSTGSSAFTSSPAHRLTSSPADWTLRLNRLHRTHPLITGSPADRFTPKDSPDGPAERTSPTEPPDGPARLAHQRSSDTPKDTRSPALPAPVCRRMFLMAATVAARASAVAHWLAGSLAATAQRLNRLYQLTGSPTLVGSPAHRLTGLPSPAHRLITGSPAYRFTGSPAHRLTDSPAHRLTGSPAQRLNRAGRLAGSPAHRLTGSLAQPPSPPSPPSPAHRLTAWVRACVLGEGFGFFVQNEQATEGWEGREGVKVKALLKMDF